MISHSGGVRAETRVSDEMVRAHLKRVLAAEVFVASPQASRLLEYTVERTLAGDADSLKEAVIGTEVWGRNANYDPRDDSVVRVNASRLRTKLAEFYSGPGFDEPVRISYPKGTYVPLFERAPARTARAPRLDRRLWWAIPLSLGLGAGVGSLWPRRKPPPPLIRFQVPAPLRATSELDYHGPVQISPDGKKIAFAAQQPNETTSIWVHSLETMTTTRLQGSENGLQPFWSPDGAEIAFRRGPQLHRAGVDGGGSRWICDSVIARSGSWSTRGVLLFPPTHSSGLVSVPASGGSPLPVTSLMTGEEAHLHPWFLPDGNHFLFTVRHQNPLESGIFVGSLDQPASRKKLVNAVSNAVFASVSGQGALLFSRNGTLMAVRFDPARLEVKSDEQVIEQRVGTYVPYEVADFSASTDGTVVFRAGGDVPEREMLWLDRKGRRLESLPQKGLYRYPAISPDGKQVAVEIVDPSFATSDIWLMDARFQGRTRFTLDPGKEAGPVWSPSGDRIAYHSGQDLYVKAVRGTGLAERLDQSRKSWVPTSWSPDGRFLLFNRVDPKTTYDIWVLPLEGRGPAFAFQRSAAYESDARFSPDGRWIAYTSSDAGQFKIYVEPFSPAAPVGGRVQISEADARAARWRADGRELYFMAGFRLHAASIQPGEAFSFRKPEPLFEVPGFLWAYGYDVAPDGQRFLFSATVAAASEISNAINVMVGGLSRLTAPQ